MKVLKFMLFLSVLGAMGAGGYWYLGGWPGSADARVAKEGVYVVKRGDLVISLTERGTFQARQSSPIRAQIRGGAKVEWLVDEGSFVNEGDVVVELDKTEVLNRVEQFQNQIIQYRAELKAAETEEIIQEAQNKTDNEKAQLDYEVAVVELKKLNEGDIVRKERDLALAIETAESDLNLATDLVEANAELFKEEFVTKNDVEEGVIEKRKAENALQTAKLLQRLYQVHERPLLVKQKNAAVVEAERGLGRAEKRAEAELQAKSARVQQKRLSLSVAETGLRQQEEELEKMTLRAPTNGLVLYGGGSRSRWGNDDEIKVGSQVWARTAIATIPDISEMSVGIEVHETDIEKLAVGMPAAVTSETHKGRTFLGSIARIDSVANAGNRWRGDVKKFKVAVELEKKDLGLKPGTSARVEIQIGEAKDALFVPVQAVHARDGKFFCYVAQRTKVRRAYLQLGHANETHVEIKSGLDEGDRVLLYDPDIIEAESEGQAPGPGGRKAEIPQP